MSNGTKSPQELPLDENTAYTDYRVGRLVDDNDLVVCARSVTHSTELGDPSILSWVGNDCEDFEDREVTTVIVRRCQRTNLCIMVRRQNIQKWREEGTSVRVSPRGARI